MPARPNSGAGKDSALPRTTPPRRRRALTEAEVRARLTELTRQIDAEPDVLRRLGLIQERINVRRQLGAAIRRTTTDNRPNSRAQATDQRP